MIDDAANPIGERHARRPERTRQIAEIEMRVGVDQPGQHGDVAQVLDLARRRVSRPTATIRSPVDRHRAVGNRLADDGKDVAGFEACKVVAVMGLLGDTILSLQRASDPMITTPFAGSVHLTPPAARLRLRCRVDGVLQDLFLGLFIRSAGRTRSAAAPRRRRPARRPASCSRNPPFARPAGPSSRSSGDRSSISGVIWLTASASVLWTTWNTMPGRMLPVCTAR